MDREKSCKLLKGKIENKYQSAVTENRDGEYAYCVRGSESGWLVDVSDGLEN